MKIGKEIRKFILATLSREDRKQVLAQMPLEDRLAGLTPKEVKQFVEKVPPESAWPV